MNRYKLVVEYCGTAYHGMQRQDNLPTVQLAIESALQKYCGQGTIHYCGRTDKGVHAIGQVVHFDTPHNRSNFSVVSGINFYLRKEQVSVISAEKVDSNFHSRFSAKKRSYLYKIINRSSKLTFHSSTHLHYYLKLDTHKMQEAANFLIGKHDFTSFRSSGCYAETPIKTIDQIVVRSTSQPHGQEVTIEICAKSFLYNMVRNIVGTLVVVGSGKRPPEWVNEVLVRKNRAVAADTAPAHGLYFLGAEY